MKNIRIKLPAVFAAVTAAVTVFAACTEMFFACADYCREFQSLSNAFFSQDFVSEASALAADADAVPFAEDGNIILEDTGDDGAARLRTAVAERLAQKPLPITCDVYILDAISYDVLYALRSDTVPEPTSSLKSAVSSGRSFETSYIGKYLDYAQAVPPSDGEYIVYVYDSRTALNEKLKQMAVRYAKTAAAAVLFALICGIAAAKSVVKPVKLLNEKVRALAGKNPPDALDLFTPDEAGELARTVSSVAQNLRAAAESALAEKQQLETVLENIHDGIMVFSADGRLIRINRAAGELLGRRYLNDINFDKFFKEINADITLGDILYGAGKNELTERSVTADKKRRLQLSFTAFETDGRARGALVLIHDITRHEKLEQSRRDFVADVSHELRTPLTTIKSYSETLIDSPDADHGLVVKFLSVIASEAERMSRIVGDLLTLSRLDASNAKYTPPEEIDVRALLKALADRMALNAQRKGLTLTYTPINEVPHIIGDRDLFERAVINIISNAVKYTPEGGRVEIYSSRMFNEVCIKVKDTGIGIPAEHLPHIFDRFYRVDKARSRDKGGTGLGLAIAKQTIESSFGGRIEIDSEVGKGTEVLIAVPVKA